MEVDLDIVRRPAQQKGFQVLLKRRIVERTFAWLSRYRRLSKDYEGLPSTSEAWIYVAQIRQLLRRHVRRLEGASSIS